MGRRIILLWIALASILFLYGCSSNPEIIKPALPPESQWEDSEYLYKSDMLNNPYETLCVPTQMEKLGEDYFIVDCYHDQIITSEDAKAPLGEWKQVTNQINKGHTIASDGFVYLYDDTDNHQVVVMVKKDGVFYMTQVFENIGKRPHFVSYDSKRDCFFVLSSLTGEIYTFRRKSESYEVEAGEVHSLKGLNDIYIRSFSIIDDEMFLPAGDGFIYRVDMDSFQIKEKYPLAATIAGPVQLSKIKSKYYLTVSTDILINKEAANIVMADKLEDFADSEKYTSVRNKFSMEGTPYVITEIDGEYMLCIHSDNGPECMWQFKVNENGEIAESSQMYK